MKSHNNAIHLAAFFGIASLLALISAGAGGGPIVTGLGIRTSDILSFLVLNKSSYVFAGSNIEHISHVVSSSIPFNWFLSSFFSGGRLPEYTRVGLYLMNVFFQMYLYMIIGRAATGRFIGGPFLLLLVIFSIETVLFPYRLISSTIATTFALAIIASCLYDRYFLAAAIAGVTVCIHPTMGLFLFSIVIISYFLIKVASGVRYASTFRVLLPMIGVFFLFVSPFFVMSATEITSKLTQQTSDQETWWSFVPSINNLAFPMTRGLVNLLSHASILVLTGILAIFIDRGDHQSRLFILSTICVLVAAYMTQVLFTSAFKVQFVAQLALNHRVTAISLPLCFVTFAMALSSSVRKLDLNWLAWFLLSAAFILHDGWNIGKVEYPGARLSGLINTDYVQADVILLLVISIVFSQSFRFFPTHIVATAVVIFVIFAGWALNDPGLYYFIAPVILWYFHKSDVTFGSLTARCIKKWKKIEERIAVSPNLLLLLFLVFFMSAGLVRGLPTHQDTLSAWSRLYRGEMLDPWVKNFLEKYIPEADHVIVLPLRDQGVWLTPTPWRRAYLDPLDGHYLLYNPPYLNQYLERLKPYAGKAAKEELEDDWYLNTNVWRDADGIRSRITEVQEIDEKARWVLTFDRFLCGNDVVHAEYDGYGSGPPGYLGKVVLLKASDLDSECVSEPGSSNND